MISRLEILLETESRLSFQMGSAFHGALMELVSGGTCELLHNSAVHPFSQYLERRSDGWHWVVTALTQELSTEIIHKGLLPCDGIELKKAGIKLSFSKKQLLDMPMEKLSERMYHGSAPRHIDVEFITPTSFKQEGRYLFYPDIRGMYISLLNKYGAVETQQDVKDEDMLKELVRHTQISKYNLRSVLYFVDSGKVPAFIGSVGLRLSGPETLRSFVDFLFHFGEYSSIGIKGGLGMGGMRVVDVDKDKEVGK